MRDIHLKVDDDLFDRWQKCAKHRGQRSHLARRLVREVVEYLEKEIEPEIQMRLPLKTPKS